MKYPEINDSISFMRLRVFIGGLVIAFAGLIGSKKSVNWAQKVIVYGEWFCRLEKGDMAAKNWMGRRRKQ
ncbi:hypothetical protein HGO23_12890 [Xenorhabdus budapestensis]|uniref:Uncharacterized protein n=1 Tax=Xenorhabdus budapestensis TaxID=290110 RepID=A0ABX7VG32_XENBU|nr:hypothetical protein [Xenorhabdus budapestensis]QTL38772.1 hypothetical protein HGO23_12890 [Xenorhabdus budapestensis]